MIAAELRGGSKPSLNEALGWIGSRVDDIYGANVGRLDDVWIDPGTGVPRWLLVKEGRFGGRTTLIPFEDATAGAGHVWVPYERDVVRDAPEIEPGAPLTQEVETALRTHYSANAPAAISDRGGDPRRAAAGPRTGSVIGTAASRVGSPPLASSPEGLGPYGYERDQAPRSPDEPPRRRVLRERPEPVPALPRRPEYGPDPGEAAPAPIAAAGEPPAPVGGEAHQPWPPAQQGSAPQWSQPAPADWSRVQPPPPRAQQPPAPTRQLPGAGQQHPAPAQQLPGAGQQLPQHQQPPGWQHGPQQPFVPQAPPPPPQQQRPAQQQQQQRPVYQQPVQTQGPRQSAPEQPVAPRQAPPVHQQPRFRAPAPAPPPATPSAEPHAPSAGADPVGALSRLAAAGGTHYVEIELSGELTIRGELRSVRVVPRGGGPGGNG